MGRINNIYRFIIILFVGLFATNTVLAKGSDVPSNELDVKTIVLEHIGDSYGWHIVTVWDKHITLPLPVIVKSTDNGWNIFLSDKLEYGADYNGFYISEQDPYKGKIVEKNSSGIELRPQLDISITKNTLAIIINSLILLFVVLYTAKWYKTRPNEVPPGVRGAMEILIENIYEEVVKPCIGEDYRRYAPYLLTVFFFIFINNLMGLIPIFPGGANTTGNIAITLVLALFTFFAVNFFGTKEYWKEIIWPEIPVWLKFPLPIMPVLEVFGIITKPFALMIRLFANIMAGHSVIVSLVCVIFITVYMGVAANYSISAIMIVFSIFMNFIELLVAFIQAYVFTMLSAVFIGLSRVKKEKIHN